VVTGYAVSLPNMLFVEGQRGQTTTAIAQAFAPAAGSSQLVATFDVRVQYCAFPETYAPIVTIRLGNYDDPTVFLTPRGDGGSGGLTLTGGLSTPNGISTYLDTGLPIALGVWSSVTFSVDVSAGTGTIGAGDASVTADGFKGPADDVTLELGTSWSQACDIAFDNVTFAWAP